MVNYIESNGFETMSRLEGVRIEKNDALIVVDVQNDFVPGGALAVTDGDQIVGPINELGLKFRMSNNHIIFTQDWHPKGHHSFASVYAGKNPFDPIEGIEGIGPVLWPDHCVQGTEGAEFHPNLDVSLAHLIIRKGYNPNIDSYSAILENDKKTETGLAGYLNNKGITRLFICGLALDYCVNFTAQDAALKGFEVVVIEDLTRGINEETVKSSMEQMTSTGIYFVNSTDFSD
jgi:nicotinamidase/pyrazinamidase